MYTADTVNIVAHQGLLVHQYADRPTTYKLMAVVARMMQHRSVVTLAAALNRCPLDGHESTPVERGEN